MGAPDVSGAACNSQQQGNVRWEQSPCPECKGARLNKTVLGCKINGYNTVDLSWMEVSELIFVIRGVQGAVAKPMVNNPVERLQNVVDIGLDYLALNRETDTLYGGEPQRLKIVKHLSSSLTDMMYIFDEPSVDKSIAQVLDVTVREALDYFNARRPEAGQAVDYEPVPLD